MQYFDYADRLESLRGEGRLRNIPLHSTGDEYVLDLTDNDYLALARHADEYRQEFSERFGIPAMTSSASRLLASDQNVYSGLENYIGRLYGKSALLFNSGYHVNTGVIPALCLPKTLIISDKLNHASIIDGVRLSGAECIRFPHNDMAKLRNIVERKHREYERVIIITESIFSMDGDKAPLNDLVAIKRDYPNVMLYIDEAHAFGVNGERGLGVSEEKGLINDIDVIVVTLGKAAASAGAFVVVDEVLKEWLLNSSRSFIFSTSLPPINVAWSHFMIENITRLKTMRQQLALVSEMLRTGIEKITGESNVSTTQIVPLMVGDAQRAVELSEALKRDGYRALPIRRPTVPAGTERIRFSLNADVTPRQVEDLLAAINKCYSIICGRNS